jgi:hypothetical protein
MMGGPSSSAVTTPPFRNLRLFKRGLPKVCILSRAVKSVQRIARPKVLANYERLCLPKLTKQTFTGQKETLGIFGSGICLFWVTLC